MSIKVRVAATAIVAACAVSFATSASAFIHYCPPKAPPKAPPHGGGSTGKIFVGCIMGSAAGLIYASIVKGGGLKFMTQKEWEDLKVKVPNPLTTEEAMLVAGTCGLAAFTIRPAKSAPVVVRAGG
jgi:hypothetical protein